MKKAYLWILGGIAPLNAWAQSSGITQEQAYQIIQACLWVLVVVFAVKVFKSLL